MSNLKGTITFSSPSDGSVRIQIRDDQSFVRFLEIKLSHEDLSTGLMGLAERPMTFELNNVEHVGKTKYVDKLTMAMPRDLGYDERKSTAIALVQEYIAELSASTGKKWLADLNFSSQDSFTYGQNQEQYLHTRIYYYE